MSYIAANNKTLIKKYSHLEKKKEAGQSGNSLQCMCYLNNNLTGISA